MRAQPVVLLALLVACARERRPAMQDPASFVRGGSGHATVTYQPDVRIVEREPGIAALRGVSRDGSTLLFDPGVPALAALRSGDILLIKGLLARKVLTAGRVGSQIAVLTEPASLGEVIRDGHIELDVPIRFTAAPTRRAARSGGPPWNRVLSLVIPEAHAQGPDVERQKNAIEAGKSAGNKKALNAVTGVFEGWETSFSVTPQANRVGLSITLRKDVGGFVALITGNGYLADFDLSTRIDVDQGLVERLQLVHRRLNGVMNFNWRVSKDTPGALSGNDRIKLPAALSIPLYQYLDGLPLFLEISAAVIIEPAISGGKEYSRGAFRVTYDGTQGFEAKAGNIDAEGHVTGDIQFIESQNISPLAPMGMVVAFAAPRIELTFGTTKLIDMGDIQTAANAVDEIADKLIQGFYGQEGLDRFRSSTGGMTLSKAIHDVVSSDAAGYVELVTSTGMSYSGMSAIFPCSHTDIHLIVKVGASAQILGQELGKTQEEIFNKGLTRVDPPGTKLCESVGN